MLGLLPGSAITPGDAHGTTKLGLAMSSGESQREMAYWIENVLWSLTWENIHLLIINWVISMVKSADLTHKCTKNQSFSSYIKCFVRLRKSVYWNTKFPQDFKVRIKSHYFLCLKFNEDLWKGSKLLCLVDKNIIFWKVVAAADTERRHNDMQLFFCDQSRKTM